jgi:FtsZ-interacting cell division protein YlmF
MDFRDLTGRAAERIKAVFSKDNRFFYGTSDHHDAGYQEEVQQTPVQGVYTNAYAQPNYQQQQPYQQQPVYTQNSYQQAQQPQYQQYQQATPQQHMQQSAPQQNWQQQAYQEPVYQASPQQIQHVSPQQVQLNQQQIEQSGRNRRAAQHMQAPQPDNNIVQFPGTMPEQESRQMDAYVVNITNITGCRQAMTCLRKGQCTLVVMDQLIDKAEVRRYVDMLNGACFALGGTMTRLSLKVGFYILAPSGMMVYTDPVTASANAPQVRSQPAAQQQNAFPQQPAYQQPPVYQQQPVYGQQNVQQQAQPFQQPAQNPFAPPMNAAPLDQSRDSYDAQRFVQ